MHRKYDQIFGLRIDSTSTSSVLNEIEKKIVSKAKFYIVTPNPEIVLISEKDQALREAINHADFSVPDGIGLKYASLFLNGTNLEIFPGRKLMVGILTILNKKNSRVFCLAGREEILKVALNKLSGQFNNVKFEGRVGPVLNSKGNPVSKRDINIEKDIINHINKFKPDVVFVGFGAPKQEKWIYRSLPKINTIGAMVVGGTFDYLAQQKIVPEWISRLGFEWAWRLAREPYRIKRIINAVIIFPLRVLVTKFNGD